jgi:hypothetical protein
MSDEELMSGDVVVTEEMTVVDAENVVETIVRTWWRPRPWRTWI